MRGFLKLLIPVFVIPGLLSCGNEKTATPDEREVPVIVSSVPANGVQNLETESLVVRITFNMDMSVVMSEADKVSAGDADILNVSAKGPVVSIFMNGLQNGGSYRLHIPAGVLKGASGACAEEIVLTFSRSYHYEYNPTALLSNRSSSRQTQVVYDYLRIIAGRKMMSGVFNLAPGTNDFLTLVGKTTNLFPAVSGYDYKYVYQACAPAEYHKVKCNYSDLSNILQHWSANGLVSFMWTWMVPTDEKAWRNAQEHYAFDGYFSEADRTHFSLARALRAGTWENECLMNDLDTVAGYLKLLQQEGVTVLWQPLHVPVSGEDAVPAFWWGNSGAEAYKSLWMMMHQLFSTQYGLDNLIYVWSAEAPGGDVSAMMEWYPGDDFVDVVGTRIYADTNDPQTALSQSIVDALQGRKVIAVTECGNLPKPSSWIAAGDKWSWFCAAPSVTDEGRLALSCAASPLNTVLYWHEIMNDAYTVTRDKLPDMKSAAEAAMAGAAVIWSEDSL